VHSHRWYFHLQRGPNFPPTEKCYRWLAPVWIWRLHCDEFCCSASQRRSNFASPSNRTGDRDRSGAYAARRAAVGNTRAAEFQQIVST